MLDKTGACSVLDWRELPEKVPGLLVKLELGEFVRGCVVWLGALRLVTVPLVLTER